MTVAPLAIGRFTPSCGPSRQAQSAVPVRRVLTATAAAIAPSLSRAHRERRTASAARAVRDAG
ncbi:hypothetical protein ACIBAI_27210 [Streptomyces sp. NPDC051041]|uniref:hypothetical protein n=1 Tax=Streptomyces sp. NPDC051041 TaxID=3365640 RepID=UPI00379E67BA